MTDTERGIALATLDDVSGILDLQDRNLRTEAALYQFRFRETGLKRQLPTLR
jgi:hypothetical protein